MSNVAVIEVTRPADDDWDVALEQTGRPFRVSHTSAAGRAFERAYASYAYEPCRVRYGDGTSLLFPVVRATRRVTPLSMALAMPLSLEGGAIAQEGEATVAHVEAFFAALDGVGMLAIHGGAGGSPPRTGSVTPGATHTLDLTPGFAWLWDNKFSSKNRNVCRKAERAGVAVADETNATGAAEYARLYATAATAWGYDEPPYPAALFSALVDSGGAELWLARRDEQAIAGALLLRGSDDLLYWSGAMDREHGAVAPSNAILRTVIESACERGLGYLDFGASSGLTGVEKFKRSFGAREVDFHSIELSRTAYRMLERSRRLVRGSTS